MTGVVGGCPLVGNPRAFRMPGSVEVPCAPSGGIRGDLSSIDVPRGRLAEVVLCPRKAQVSANEAVANETDSYGTTPV